MSQLAWLLILIVLGVGVVFAQEQAAKAHVVEYLERRGCDDILVHTKLFAGGKGTITFDVEYADKSGNVRQNSCVVKTGFFSERTIYWKKPLGIEKQLDYEEKEDFNLWSGS